MTPAQWNPRDQPSLQTEDMEEDKEMVKKEEKDEDKY